MRIKIVSRNGRLPQYETSGSSGMDLRSVEAVVIGPGERALVATGIFIELPQGYEGQVRARSGLAVKHGIGLVNGIGTIDSDYRGEIKIPLINWGTEPYKIEKDDRIAQLIISKYERINWELVEELGQTKRNEKGFGSSGK
ncbi:MAG: dUTP diphosphatase [Anaerovoracaceae bacterium]|jgi:dUTP pyrophosphatase|nr:dUTP diphosphatase [Anaerovoracaceae bacterium]